MERTTIGLPNTCRVCGAGDLPHWYAAHADAAIAGQGVCEACAFPPPPPPEQKPEQQAPPELAQLIGPDGEPLAVPPGDLVSDLAEPPVIGAAEDDELITGDEPHTSEDPDGLHVQRRPRRRA